MPRNPAGTAYSTPNTFVYDTLADPDKVNANFTDVGTELVNSLPADGRRAMSGALRLANGVVTLPGLSFASDPDTGLFWTASGEFAVSSNGAEVARFTPGGLTLSNPESLLAIGDKFDTYRTLDATWLRRNGALYDIDDYPTLAALMPALDDGVLWENEPSGVSTGKIQAITVGPDRLAAIQDDGTNSAVLASIDGAPWDIRATLTGFRAEGIAYNGSVYLAVDGNGKFSTSSDGDVWSAPSTISGAVGLTQTAYGNGVFIATGVKSANARGLWTSTDGSVWTDRSSAIAGTGLVSFVSFVNNVFIIGGASGFLATSTDATAWATRTTGVTEGLNGAGYFGGVYVVVGDTGRIITSSNLNGWTPRSSGTSATLNAAVGNSLGFLVVGGSGTARISDTAATSWLSSPTGVTSNLLGAIIDPDEEARYIVVGPPAYHLYGLRTTADQFRVPNDDPATGWIKALNELP